MPNPSPKELNGRELAGFIKERQFHRVTSLKGQKIFPKLCILRDNDDPVIETYVRLKRRYGEDIGVSVDDIVVKNTDELQTAIDRANHAPDVSALIIQLPLKTLPPEPKSPPTASEAPGTASRKTPDTPESSLDALLAKIAPEKDVDGLSKTGAFDSATATAILWLLAGYDIDLSGKKIALVGRGRLVGAPLYRMLKNSGNSVELFHRGSDLEKLTAFDIIITATGVPGLIKSAYLKPGAVVVDAGTASEDGVLKGDLDEAARARPDLKALTPKLGGVGPLTISVLFENVITAAERQNP
ncbi:bifunctional 5,10-methylenetetrahydrofolate dehydrogenase/5,10-methenyltetrahydrofolate cyclohydrolase [Candidatus Saccharibacteria bacterium]|nr:bifunctional 5,10-methylenetetrahydrofolate dehydrogenase/5,10-methenyltetrahydrofolate cyclohydrolase [Candidatus Saccharibacteria bacterium]